MRSLNGGEILSNLETKEGLIRDKNINLDYENKLLNYYSIKYYRQCLNEIITNNEEANNEDIYIIALCCLLLQKDIESNIIADIKSKIKRDGFINLIHAYNYLAAGIKYTGDSKIFNKFARILTDSSDGNCIKYIRDILENFKDIDCIDIARKAYEKGLLYLSEEIINLYCNNNRYDYDILIILIKVHLDTGKLKECEKYISLARVINDSLELGKLECICRLRSCKNIISKFKELDKDDDLQMIYKYFDDAEKLLLK